MTASDGNEEDDDPADLHAQRNRAAVARIELDVLDEPQIAVFRASTESGAASKEILGGETGEGMEEKFVETIVSTPFDYELLRDPSNLRSDLQRSMGRNPGNSDPPIGRCLG